MRSVIMGIEPEWEVHPHSVQQQLNAERDVEPLVLRAGHGVVAVIHHDPGTGWVFAHDLPKYPSGGRFARRPYMKPPFGFPVDIVGVTDSGKAWLLEPLQGRVSSEDIGGYPYVLGILRTSQRVRRGCLFSASRLAYLDDTLPLQIFVRDFGESVSTDTLSVSAEWLGTDSTSWASLRFGGASVGHCILWAPKMEVVLRVSDSGTVAVGPLIEPPRAEGAGAALLRWIRRGDRAPLVGDATTFPGGVAVLMAGRGPDARRVIDV
ncbi:MAG TPA: hypothetical protein VF178_00080 [Gemmatimonadaceae bacterium]